MIGVVGGKGEEEGRLESLNLSLIWGWGVLLLLLEVVREGQDFGGYGVWDLICNLSFFLRQKKAVFIYEALCLLPSS
jgi:hypothetical protein